MENLILKEHLSEAKDLINFLNSSNKKDVIFALHLLALRLIKKNLLREALHYLDTAFILSDFSDQEIIKNLALVCHLLNDQKVLTKNSFLFARNAIFSNKIAEGLEALGFSWFLVANKRIEEPCLLSITETINLYKKIAEFLNISFKHKLYNKKKIRVGHLLYRLIDDVNSPTKLLKTFVKYHNYEKIECFVYTSEEFALKNSPKFCIGTWLPYSKISGTKTIKYLEDLGISFYQPSLDGSSLDTAIDLAKKIYEDKIDVLIYYTNIMCCNACLVSILKPAPIQINMNIGAPMYTDTVDCVTYFVKSNWEKELEFWKQKNIRSEFMPSGVDLEENLEGKTFDISSLGIPSNSVVLATCGHYLPRRMGDDFLEVLVEILKRNPSSYYLVIGPGEFPRLEKKLLENNLVDRVKFLGFRSDAARIIKSIDIYLNEFPEGGGLSVLEAMASKKPVVAMRYDKDLITTTAGADYVGEEFAIKSKDYKGYVDFASKLIRDSNFRYTVGLKMFQRYKQEFSPQRMVKAFEDLILELFDSKITKQ